MRSNNRFQGHQSASRSVVPPSFHTCTPRLVHSPSKPWHLPLPQPLHLPPLRSIWAGSTPSSVARLVQRHQRSLKDDKLPPPPPTRRPRLPSHFLHRTAHPSRRRLHTARLPSRQHCRSRSSSMDLVSRTLQLRDGAKVTDHHLAHSLPSLLGNRSLHPPIKTRSRARGRMRQSRKPTTGRARPSASRGGQVVQAMPHGVLHPACLNRHHPHRPMGSARRCLQEALKYKRDPRAPIHHR